MPKSDKHAEAWLKYLFWNSIAAGDTPAGPDVLDHFGSAGTTMRISTTAGTLHASLHTASPGYTGTQSTNEISYTTYGRISLARSNSAWSYSTTGGPNMSNVSDLTFGAMASGTGGTARFWGLGLDASGGGDLIYFGALGLEVQKPFAVVDLTTDATLANNDIVCPGHGYAADDQVQFIDAGGGAIPAGLTEGTWYWVISAGLATDKFRVSTSQGGGAVDITAVGSGYVQKALQKTVGVGDEPVIKAGKMVIYER